MFQTATIKSNKKILDFHLVLLLSFVVKDACIIGSNAQLGKHLSLDSFGTHHHVPSSSGNRTITSIVSCLYVFTCVKMHTIIYLSSEWTTIFICKEIKS